MGVCLPHSHWTDKSELAVQRILDEEEEALEIQISRNLHNVPANGSEASEAQPFRLEEEKDRGDRIDSC